jgi:hypothetical protein
MAKVDENLYRQEIEELTDFVRHDEGWLDLRNILTDNGFFVDDTLLVSFLEDEEEMEYGVIVTKDKKIFEYSRSTEEDNDTLESFKLLEITHDNDKIDKYPQIPIALKMIG